MDTQEQVDANANVQLLVNHLNAMERQKRSIEEYTSYSLNGYDAYKLHLDLSLSSNGYAIVQFMSDLNFHAVNEKTRTFVDPIHADVRALLPEIEKIAEDYAKKHPMYGK